MYHTFAIQPTPQNAEWIVEDFELGDGMVPFANFGTITLTNAVAVANAFDTDSIQTGLASAQIWDIHQNGQVRTSTTVSSSEVTVRYV